MKTSPIRRVSALKLAAGGTAAGVLACLLPRPASATPAEAQQALAALGSGPLLPGKVTLGAPDIAENGNTVPIVIDVDSPMTEASYVKTILVVADGNPLPGVARFDLSPINGRAHVEFRVRLAQTENLTAVALMNDGSKYSASKAIKVTIGGCGG